MVLQIGERTTDSLERVQFRAVDSDTNRHVIVTISHEVFCDRGKNVCLDKAREKYNGISNSVDVTTQDF